jgi:hypothetical protein
MTTAAQTHSAGLIIRQMQPVNLETPLSSESNGSRRGGHC